MIEYGPQPPFNSGNPSTASERVREMAAAELTRLARNPQDLISIPKILWHHAIYRSRKGQGVTRGSLKREITYISIRRASPPGVDFPPRAENGRAIDRKVGS